jgi:superfamily II DNA or RNA helicase/predicted RNA-binding Zn-ribbon protein involved in translation (DUF1610 family)
MFGLELVSSKEIIRVNAHLVIIDKEDRDRIIAAGIVDVDSAARGLAAHILKGDSVLFYQDFRRYFNSERLRAERDMFRIVSRPLSGKLNHTVVLHKAAVDENLPEKQDRIILSLAGNGDIASIFMRHFASDFNLPYVKEWEEKVWNQVKEERLVTQLRTLVDHEFPTWRHATGFKLSSDFTEERAKGILSQLLRDKFISLPSGVTEAPAVTDVLTPDEKGEYKVTDYLQTFAPHLATTIEDMAEPLHDIDRPIDVSIADMARTPFPAQAHTAQAILNGFAEGNKGVFAASDMGCGKSIIALAVANAMSKKQNGYKTFMLVPGITIPKWIRDEISSTLPDAKVTVMENWRDVLAYKERIQTEEKIPLEFVVMSRDTAKLGMPRVPSLIYKKRWIFKSKTIVRGAQYVSSKVVEDVWLCPDCGEIQVKQTKEATKKLENGDLESLLDFKLGYEDLKIRHDDSWRDSVSSYHCSSCGNNLMRLAVPEHGEYAAGLKHSRLEPASLIADLLPGVFDLLIVDELHQYKNLSGQGEAMGQLVDASKKTLGLTGTLSDGKASSLFYILRRTAPMEMNAAGMDEKSLGRFVVLYGSQETKTRVGDDDIQKGGTSTRRKVVKNPPPKEIPGLSPRLFVNHLANKTAFLELGDMGLPLVELEERPVFVQMDDNHQKAYSHFHETFEREAKVAYALGNDAPFAKFIPSVVNVANQPHKGYDTDYVNFLAVNTPEQLSAKERKLLEDVKAEVAQNRRCVVYVRYSGDAMQDNRIRDILKDNKIRVRMMKASTDPEDRVEWLEKAVEDDIQVVVLNAKLVEVGLDLLEFPTLMFYQFTDEIATMRQASRRAWRIGQHRACKVLYYVYEQSYEVVQFKRMLAKRSHAMLLEGRLDRSEVATFTAHDSKSASTFNIAACLGDMDDLSAKWRKLADKDIPAGVMMLKEDEFKREIKRAMLRLSNETRALAGLPPLPAVQLVQTEPIVAANVDDAFDDVFLRPDLDDLLSNLDTVEQQEVTIALVKTVESEPIMVKTAAEIRAEMGLVAKAKRVKKAVNDDQLGWDF